MFILCKIIILFTFKKIRAFPLLLTAVFIPRDELVMLGRWVQGPADRPRLGGHVVLGILGKPALTVERRCWFRTGLISCETREQTANPRLSSAESNLCCCCVLGTGIVTSGLSLWKGWSAKRDSPGQGCARAAQLCEELCLRVLPWCPLCDALG